MTPFQRALQQLQEGTLQAPSVSLGGEPIDYIGYQMATHKYFLSLMSIGVKPRGAKLSDIREYYGLKSRTPKAALQEFLSLMADYEMSLQS
jgi:hypothetical protein